VKRSIRRKLAAGKRRIERRLRAAVRVNEGGPMLGRAKVRYEIADKVRAIAHGGIGLMQRLVREVGLAREIDAQLELLKFHKPYHESDHVLNIAYNALCGGQTLDDIEVRRNDAVFLDALGTMSIPDPTTSGDFCRRFTPTNVTELMEAINKARLGVWKRQPDAFRAETARIDADGSLVATEGQCKEGMDIAYNGVWGYHALLISLANTGEVLYLVNRPGNRPSHEGCAPWLDRSVALCRRAGFEDILLRGDTDFSLTTEFDRWSGEGVRFIFGYDARANMVERAENQPDALYRELARRADERIGGQRRTRPENVKDRIVIERGYEVMRPISEEIAEFEYQPVKCKKTYRVVALRKTLSIEEGQIALFETVRYFFYITNDWSLRAEQVVHEARHRCNQENLIDQLKNGLPALHAPVNTLDANWAYMVMTALGWNLKAWLALLLPVSPRWSEVHGEQRERLLRMEFRTFIAAMINIPCQIIRAGRRIVYRLLAWNQWQHALFRAAEAL
jgi:Transposase DDE domain group 1